MITLTTKLSVRDWAKPITYLWTKKTGPGEVVFGTPTSAQTTAAFSVPGDYRLICTATDGDFSIEDYVDVLAVA